MNTKESLKKFVAEILDNADEIVEDFKVFKSKQPKEAAGFLGKDDISEAQHKFIIKFINDKLNGKASHKHYNAMKMMFSYVSEEKANGRM